eukprot:TRINITY_DN2512_c0_g1_i1.p1 TRINITY_DN2512_c0_g1~~TRINITY_DN2512_c0_g1_i1.p1  ORF type:complete len:959 (-),score=170.88 TRINITY_DN2512_c0_g1_i1:55-2931(-)
MCSSIGRLLPILLISALTAMVGLVSYWDAFVSLDLDKPNLCSMTWMMPTYQRIPFTNVSRLEYKYKLYLYREAPFFDPHKDIGKVISGVPVIFMPGHAGDHTQVRSLGSISARMTPLKEKQKLLRDRGFEPLGSGNEVTDFDWFSININEELSALSGNLLLEQAEFLNDCIQYILTIYEKNLPPTRRPSSVILLGHSMGGVVSRAALSIHNYKPNSVQTIFTISSPHRATILSHPTVYEFYRHVNNFWRTSFLNESSEVHNVTIVSIAGGIRDNLIRSELCNLENLLHSDNQLTTVSTQIPDVWVSVDHVAAVWCNSLLVKIISSLHGIIDPNTKLPTLSKEQRMKTFRDYFKSSIPNAIGVLPMEIQSSLRPFHEFPVPHQGQNPQDVGVDSQFLRITKITGHNKQIYSWDIPKISQNKEAGDHFTILTNIKPNFLSLLCKEHLCLELTNEFVPFPYKFVSEAKFQITTYKATLLNLPLSRLSDFDRALVSINSTSTKKPEHFIYAGVLKGGPHDVISSPPLLWDWEKEIGGSGKEEATQPFMVHIKLEDVSKFMVFKVYALDVKCPGDGLSPVFLQYTPGMNEERYQEMKLSIRFHEIEPNSSLTSDVHLIAFYDPKCTFKISISFSLLESISHIFRSYMNLVVAPSTSISLVIYSIQIFIWQREGVFKPFSRVLISLLHKVFPFLVVSFIISLVVDYYWSPQHFIEHILDVLSISGHSFTKMVKPWPSMPMIIFINLVSFCTNLMGSQIAYYVLKQGYRVKSYKDVKRGDLNGYSKSKLLVAMLLGLLVLMRYYGKHFGLEYSVHEWVCMFLTFTYFVWFCRKSRGDENQFNFDHTLLWIYAQQLALTFPEFVATAKIHQISSIWQLIENMKLKELTDPDTTIISSSAFVTLIMILHLFYSDFFLKLSKTNGDILGCLILAVGIEVYCMWPFFRVVDFMSFFAFVNLPYVRSLLS